MVIPTMGVPTMTWTYQQLHGCTSNDMNIPIKPMTHGQTLFDQTMFDNKV